LNLGGRDLNCQSVLLMLKIQYAGWFSLSQAVSAQFTVEMCVAAQNREKITKNPYFGSARSFKIVDLDVIRKAVWDFLLVTNSNLDPISHRF